MSRYQRIKPDEGGNIAGFNGPNEYTGSVGRLRTKEGYRFRSAPESGAKIPTQAGLFEVSEISETFTRGDRLFYRARGSLVNPSPRSSLRPPSPK